MMSTAHLVQNISPLGPLPRGLTTLHAAQEALAFETANFRSQVVDTDIKAERNVGESEFRLGAEEETDSEEEEKLQQERHKARIKRETQELLLLQELLPFLLQSNRLQEAEGAVCCFIDRNPRNADGFVLLADVYSHRDNLAAACECLWGAIYNSPGNRMLLRLLRNSEEQFLLRQCDLPLSFQFKSLAVPNRAEDEVAPSGDILDSIFSSEGAPVVIVRQGNHVAALANKDLEPGDIVFRQRPFVMTPLMLESGQIYSSCFHCMQEREDPGRGYSCPVSPYTCPFVFCSWECLMHNSRIHALECQAIPLLLAAAKESNLSATTVLHIFRTIAKAGLERQGRQDLESSEDSKGATTDVIEQLLTLNSYRAAVVQGQPELYRQLTILARRLQKQLPAQLLLYLRERDLIELMLVLWQYSPFLTSPSPASAVDRRNPDGAVGQVLAPAVALLHHSCVPTCGLSLQEDGLVAVRALTFIPAGGSLCVSLEEDLFRSQKHRKGVTAPPRIFGCGCLRCTDSAEGGRRLRGIRCFSCVRGFLCPHKSKSLALRLRAYSAAISSTIDPDSFVQEAKSEPKFVGIAEALGLKKQEEDSSKAAVPRNKTPDDGDQKQQDDDQTLDEEWLCTCCGLASPAVSRSCALVEREVEKQQALAERALVSGSRLKARQEYTSLVQQYSSQLHPQHAVLYNSHTILAGLLASQPAKDSPQAMQLDQHCRRGPSLPPSFIMGPMYSALWNCCVCFGNDSSLAIVLQQKLRRYAALLSVCTPPLMHKPRLRTVDVFVGLYRQVTGCRAESDQAIVDHFSLDPMFLAVALVRRGFCFPLTLELFNAMKDIPHLPTGLTLLGLACVHKQVDIVRELLKMGFDMFHRTSLGVTALLAMCAGTKPTSEHPDALADLVTRQTAILRLLLQRCELLDARELSRPKVLFGLGTASPRENVKKTDIDIDGIKGDLRQDSNSAAAGSNNSAVWSNRNRLLIACTHKLLGQSSALHLAASTGRAKLCWQLLVAGCLVGTLNSEAATALHLASIVGDTNTVKVLLHHGAVADATTLRGETPLVLAAYNLHKDVCILLLEAGADSALLTRTERFSVLHAVAAGLTRQVSVMFRGLSWEGDGASIALSGLSRESADLGIYTQANSYIVQESLVDVRLPCASPVNTEIFLFPGTMLERTQKAKEVLLVMMKHCPSGLYKQQSRRGLSPEDLLLRMWDAFVDKRERILQIGDLQLEGQTREERNETEGAWEFVLHQIFVIRDMLRPELAPLPETELRSEYVDTPRKSELEHKNKEKRVEDAPWLFPELTRRSAPSSKPAPYRKTLIPREPKADTPGGPSLQPKPSVVGTGIQFLPESKSSLLASQSKGALTKANEKEGEPQSEGTQKASSDLARDPTWSAPSPKEPPGKGPPPKAAGTLPKPKGPPSSASGGPPAGKAPPPAASKALPKAKGPLPPNGKGPPAAGGGTPDAKDLLVPRKAPSPATMGLQPKAKKAPEG